jgi:hypothetical protein
MRNEISKPSTKDINKKVATNRSTSQPRQPNTARVSPQPSSPEAIDRRRPISQPRASVAGKVLKQPNSETESAEKTRAVAKRFDSPRSRTVAAKGERPTKNHLRAPRSKMLSDAGKENKEQNPNPKAHLNVSHSQGHGDTKVFDGNDECGVQCSEHQEAMENERNANSSSAENSP